MADHQTPEGISPLYREWIAAHVPSNPAGLCGAMTLLMVEEFPELRRVRGHYVDADDRQYPHWWCVARDGAVIDPTAAQFPMPGEYVEHVGVEPTGKCLNCGGYTFNGDGVCSRQCAQEADDYFNRPSVFLSPEGAS